MVIKTAKTKVMRMSRDPATRIILMKIKREPVENFNVIPLLKSLLTSGNGCSTRSSDDLTWLAPVSRTSCLLEKLGSVNFSKGVTLQLPHNPHRFICK